MSLNLSTTVQVTTSDLTKNRVTNDTHKITMVYDHYYRRKKKFESRLSFFNQFLNKVAPGSVSYLDQGHTVTVKKNLEKEDHQITTT